MKAVVFHGVGDIRFDQGADPSIKASPDAIVRLTSSAVCGTDLHMVRGPFPGMIPGHEGVGVVGEVGRGVRKLERGDRVEIPSTTACGNCSYCRSGYTAQCDDANPDGPTAGTAFFCGPAPNGLPAEFARVLCAFHNLVRLLPDVTDDQAIPLSDIYPTAWFGAECAEVGDGDVAAAWGSGPVGPSSVFSAFQKGAHEVIAMDGHEDRPERARMLGAEAVNFNTENPVEAVKGLTRGIGPDRAIDAVGADSGMPKEGPAAEQAKGMAEQFRQEERKIAPDAKPRGDQGRPGEAPSQALTWAVETLAKAGTRTVDPAALLSRVEPMSDVIESYKQFDLRHPGWIEVEARPGR